MTTQDQRNRYQRTWNRKNPDKVRAIRAKHRATHQKYLREYHWKNQGIDITYEQYLALCEQQKHKCKICDRVKPLVVDHDHETGRVRGLLCKNCNYSLGVFGDNEAGIRKVLDYLCR